MAGSTIVYRGGNGVSERVRGTDAAAPVDESLRLRGVAGLRVVDASVMPEVTCCNTHAPILTLAERAAELVVAG